MSTSASPELPHQSNDTYSSNATVDVIAVAKDVLSTSYHAVKDISSNNVTAKWPTLEQRSRTSKANDDQYPVHHGNRSFTSDINIDNMISMYHCPIAKGASSTSTFAVKDVSSNNTRSGADLQRHHTFASSTGVRYVDARGPLSTSPIAVKGGSSNIAHTTSLVRDNDCLTANLTLEEILSLLITNGTLSNIVFAAENVTSSDSTANQTASGATLLTTPVITASVRYVVAKDPLTTSPIAVKGVSSIIAHATTLVWDRDCLTGNLTLEAIPSLFFNHERYIE